MSSPTPIVLAGAAGDLGGRILQALIARGAAVRALVRPDAPERDVARLVAAGATPVRADSRDIAAVAAACAGAACVVSALNGLREVIVDRQGVLLDAAVRAGVPRFIPSDYAADFTRTRPGDNRNFDLRREFMARVDAAPIRATSVLNGAFMDMLGAQMPLIQPGIHRVLYWGDADQPLDFTAKDDVATYTAAVALDDTAPRLLRVAGDTLSARELAAVMTDVTGSALSHAARGWPRCARHHDPGGQAHCPAAARNVYALAGHAVPARHVQRTREARDTRQRALRGHPMDLGTPDARESASRTD